MSRRTDIGQLRHRVKIYELTQVDDDHGGFTRSDPSPDTHKVTVWANVRTASSSEQFRAARVEQQLTHMMFCRFRESLRTIHGFTVIHQGRQMTITNVEVLGDRKRFMAIMLREGGAL